ncbi:MAG: hypothetical protein US50_C0001G0024 [Candidatus Nomurabacteria bacterium GW2011_GWB1_37_5]|uniref:DOD-type homing endonuclease domain-containing protein n=1 Tax=Candidatus Nomurabacteria bacterium GW2011_GWB1_37_5 TaxID=1618742 RepID=A0A0G0H1G1_9BACT|nr:MAG: hypothetical protein US50_C0001G0024 [Candidatus Nomurabacteria bacterium GW2011_GWB1_37_5]
MSESYTSRYQFVRGAQKKFIEQILKYRGWTIAIIAKKLKVSERTIRDWRRNKFRITCTVGDQLSKLTRIPLPSPRKIIVWSEHTSKAGKIGGTSKLKKYGKVCGDELFRKQQWSKWWVKEGHLGLNTLFGKEKYVYYPEKSTELAEICGILLGDGSITKNQIRITLNRVTDAEYILYVKNLLNRLFKVTPAIYQYRNKRKLMIRDVTISRKGLIDYMSSLGLMAGNKVHHQVDIPRWILDNNKYSIACVRGLIDTDGCVFTHRYIVRGKIYKYKKIAFTNKSKPLLKSVYTILKNIGLHPRFTTVFDVRLDRIQDVKKYMRIVGTHNNKHLKRYKI